MARHIDSPIVGGLASSSDALSPRAAATRPDRCALLPASSGNASKMPEVDRSRRMPNQAVVAGSASTSVRPSRRNASTSASLPGLASGGGESHQQRNRYHRSSPLLLSASTLLTHPNYEHVAAIIFSDLTVNVEVDFPIVPFSIASIFSCASDPASDISWPKCLLRSSLAGNRGVSPRVPQLRQRSGCY